MQEVKQTNHINTECTSPPFYKPIVTASKAGGLNFITQHFRPINCSLKCIAYLLLTSLSCLSVPGMPTCLLCTCLGGSVYCDDVKLTSVPPLPKETTHFYARYNRITKINKGDFAQMNKLKRIDLTANEIASIADDAFSGLPVLEELVLRENGVSQLPALPPVMTLIDASHNNIGATGIHKEAFKDMTGLLYLYLTDNHIDHIPVPLPDSLRSLHLQRNNIQMIHEDTFCNLKDFNYIRNALEDIRLDGNPINLSRTPQAYVCLPRVPIGAHI
ncbi:unnamed protein product [Oncorhynchus mykiss]|uniref:LRRNT domain-containing protein n=1 Tax=Oncorhynchus mykiss TaxID=8022 RepID=A0A060Y3P4_ONCMY|nr:unnamed protein product [Oncorhynchus mykiss]